MIALALSLAALVVPAQAGGTERARPEILDQLRGEQATGEARGQVVADEPTRERLEQERARRPEPPPEEPSPVEAALQDAVRCWLELEPREVAIGEPILCTLHVVYPPGIRVRVKDEALELDDSWILLEEGRVRSFAEPPQRETSASWVVASLEPGERRIELSSGRYEAWGTLYDLKPEPAEVRVLPELAEGEDSPRPAIGFREPPEGARHSTRPFWIAGGVWFAAVLITAVFVMRGRRRRGAPVEPIVPPGERLAGLDAAGLDDPQRVRALYFELSGLLRELADARQGADRRGATDEEWLAATAAEVGLPPELHAELAGFLSRAEAVKYGQERPTRWAAEEALTQARALAERLARPAEVAR